MQLVIVESPAKAKTIEKYLGADYKVLASLRPRPRPAAQGRLGAARRGLRDGLGDSIATSQRRVKEIADAAKNADRLILATDPDREGEAISWHVRELLKNRKALPGEVERVTFNAITKQAVTEAMAHPRQLDSDLIDAYLARRALDYLFGFTLSPVLWRKLPGAKSAGRVQSVALRLIVDREREIERFVAQEYWSVVARMQHDGTEFAARLVTFDGQKLERLSIGDEGTAERAKAAVEAGRLHGRGGRDQAAQAPPGAAVHHLDAAAGSRAQARLFGQPHDAAGAEPLRGGRDHLHAHRRRADGRAARSAQRAAAITERFDGHYLPEKPRIYETKAKNAQEAHEAIRPTDFNRQHARQRRRGAGSTT